ncbi:extracellular solute-binding protein [Blautia liquoris]|uniref:Extracellular solute-binding protein n=1 Tax=Blautia liquoris TaxID=2779518 RepID=A0A7M2RKN8_9FIRM|nr:extracellular solute-binding protein [Blautia liquoris]QOV20137.1 extracellular solute-binding protein [Blautia liquoris]
MRKKMLCTFLAAMMAATTFAGCGNDAGKDAKSATSAKSSASEDSKEKDVEKPDKIKLMIDGTVFTKENAQDKFVERFEELSGIKLELTQPDHDAYHDVLGQTFASGPDNWPDVVLLDPTYYSGYAKEGALWDMTDAWENSELKASGRINNEDLIKNLYIDGKLYGFANGRGNGCVTYVKQKWLGNCNLDVPTTYDEYINMLKAFTEGDPDGNGVDGDTYGVSSARLIGEEIPFVNYLPEFYQGAYPSFYQKDDGTWVDGFTEDSMKEAIGRLRDAYQAGYIDKESLTNGTNDCRNKFYEDKFGVFTYWAGTWATNLKVNLAANNRDDKLVALPPIKEVGKYLERRPPVFAITAACKNPEGVFKYFIESMLDGGDMQVLWTYGVEGTHWSTKAETVCGNTYEEGQFHMLESLEKPGTQWTKNNIDPMLSISDFKEKDPGAEQIAPEARDAQQLFNDNSTLAPNFVSTDEMSQYNGDLTTLKNTIIANVVTQGANIDDEYARFEKEGGTDWSKQIVDSLNKMEKK